MIELVNALLASTVEFATPILLASLGEIIIERAGILNIGIEGMMLMGAFAGFWACYVTGSPYLGMLTAIAVGMLFGLLVGFLAVHLRADQMITGLAVWILSIGLSTYLARKALGIISGGVRIQGLSKVPIPLLSEIPLLGPVFFNQNIMVYLGLALVPFVQTLLFKTTVGLKIRSVGENPRMADTLGVNVYLVRYLCLLVGGGLIGLGGSYLVLGRMYTWIENVTAGRGWLALAIVLFSDRRPYKALAGAWLFGVTYALQYYIQAMGLGIPYQLLLMLPYAMTIVVLVGVIGRGEPPAALGKPYRREEPE